MERMRELRARTDQRLLVIEGVNPEQDITFFEEAPFRGKLWFIAVYPS